jgi:outer membrane protein OmpA-like peptidoglycan-associated protein
MLATTRFFARSGHTRTGRWVGTAVAAALISGCQNMPSTGDSRNDAVTAAANNAGPAAAQPGCKKLGGNTNTENAGIGAAAGAVLGGILGSSVANTSSVGARNGALLGALGGAIAGSQYNKLIGMSEQPDGSVKLNIPGAVMFRTGSAEVSPEFAATLASVGNTVREYCGLTATIVGHTDNVGSADLNQRLSNERANAVVNYLARQGVRNDRLRAEGRGMNEPIASNASEGGRAQNRRVEVYVRPGAQ